MLFWNKNFLLQILLRKSWDERKEPQNYFTNSKPSNNIGIFLLEIHRATLPNLVTIFPLQWIVRLENNQGSDGKFFFFFNLAETKYKIIFCKASKSDLQHLWSSDSSSEPSLRQSLFNCWAVCFGERPPRMYIPYNRMFQWFVFQSLAPAPARK